MESADTDLFVQAKESCGTHSMTACYFTQYVAWTAYFHLCVFGCACVCCSA